MASQALEGWPPYAVPGGGRGPHLFSEYSFRNSVTCERTQSRSLSTQPSAKDRRCSGGPEPFHAPSILRSFGAMASMRSGRWRVPLKLCSPEASASPWLGQTEMLKERSASQLKPCRGCFLTMTICPSPVRDLTLVTLALTAAGAPEGSSASGKLTEALTSQAVSLSFTQAVVSFSSQVPAWFHSLPALLPLLPASRAAALTCWGVGAALESTVPSLPW
mmetsp:Transcript_65869/g.192698  ORF Transcript_65869/g.192698 Transcript_65869/m.192698 type:complete len:219 (+) Transcript_65869:26-682(+)